MRRFIHILTLIGCFLIMAGVAVKRNGTIFGHEISTSPESEQSSTLNEDVSSNGLTVISTTADEPGTIGYAGPTPLSVTFQRGVITEILPFDNIETPHFFARATEKVLPQYIGMTSAEAAEFRADVCTGATLSSNAIIDNINAAASTYNGIDRAQASKSIAISFKSICVLIVILVGATLPLFIRNKRYRILQLVLNVAILGFWSGTFISHALIVGIIAHGFSSAELLPIIAMCIMLAAAFLYPFAGHKNHYCTWMCPLGSLQELASHISKRKLVISPRVVKILSRCRVVLWGVLIALMWIGAGFSWMDYELFTAFIITQAPWWIIIIAAIVIVISVFINRPYCRFICPTGTLMKVAQNTHN